MTIDALADYFVKRQQAQGLPPEAIRHAITGLILWKGLLAEYEEYAFYEQRISIRPDDVATHLPNGEWEKLSAEAKKKLRAAIREKDRLRLQGLKMVLDFIRHQADSATAASPAFKELYQKQLDEYAPLPPKQRRAYRRRVSPSPQLIAA